MSQEADLGGLVIDIYIAYVIKSILRIVRNWGSVSWEKAQAKVDSSWLDGGWVWNCRTADVAYTYEFAGTTYSAIDSKPFLLETFAEDRVKKFRPGQSVSVWINPKEPKKSVLA
jgi:hypothetical protein